MKRTQRMCILIIVTVIVYAVLMNSCSQPPLLYDIAWLRRYGGAADDAGQSVQQTYDGGFIIAGRTRSFGAGSNDIILIKTDRLGDILWMRTYGGGDSDGASCVRQTADGGFVIVGYTESFGSGTYDTYLVRANESGNLLWQTCYEVNNSNERGCCVDLTSDGGYVIAAETFDWQGGRICVRKTDSDGGTIWLKLFEGGNAYSVQQIEDGGYIVAGVRDGIYLLKLDSNGDSLWARNYGQGEAYSVQQTLDGGYILAGYTRVSQDNAQDFCVIRTDAGGAVIWMKTFGWSGTDIFNAIQQTLDGGFAVVGVTSAFHAGNWRKTLVVKLDETGDTQWTRTYGSEYEEYGQAIIETREGNYVVTGSEYSYDSASEDVFLIYLEPVID